MTKREEILQEAIKCVTKDRNATHGEPEDNFATIAQLWNTYLTAKWNQALREHGSVQHLVTSKDVAVLNILQKVARIATTPNVVDHWVDAAGYAGCGGGIES